jgi:hypothetical protein
MASRRALYPSVVKLHVGRVSLSRADEADLVQDALSRVEASGTGIWEASVIALGPGQLAVKVTGPGEPRAHAPDWERHTLDSGAAEYYVRLPLPANPRDTAACVLRAVRRLLDSRRRGKYRTRGH